jgi:membrane dipeptidase
MNELECLIDVAHVSKQSVLDVFRLSKAPVIVSHAGVRGVGGVGNILDDEELDGLGENGGVIHISDFHNFSFSLDSWRDASETPNITLELVRRGYTVEEIGKIWSGNTLRVWSEVEDVAT